MSGSHRSADYIVQIRRVETTQLGARGRGRVKVHWSKWRRVVTCSSRRDAEERATALTLTCDQLTVVRVIYRGTACFIGDTHGNVDRWYP